MEQTGIVVKTENNAALVKIVRSASCGDNCGSCNLCEKKDIEIWTANSAGAQKGDSVLVCQKSTSFLLMAFTAYIVPIIAGVFARLIFGLCIKSTALCDLLAVAVIGITVFAAAKCGFFKSERFKSDITRVLNEQN